jgi:hypothetical protein
MKLHAAFRVAILALGMSLAASARADGSHHFHAIGSAAGGAEHEHAPAGPKPSTPPSGGGRWHNIPPAAGHGSQFGGDDHHWGHDGDHDWDHHWHHDWGYGDIRYFHHYDWYAWNGGYWHHGWYGPRFGWWWVVSGVWFFYPAPVYPYPNPYLPSDFAAPPPPVGAPAPAADQFWYFCPASNGYYPYVPTCPTGWQQVPVNSDPPPQEQPPQPPNPPPPGG